MTTTLEKLRTTLVAEAEATHAAYPQYAGHWDGWRVAEVTRRQSGKLGVSFLPGDLVLVSPETSTEKVAPRGRGPVPYALWPEVEFATAYSRRTGRDTAVRAEYVREVELI